MKQYIATTRSIRNQKIKISKILRIDTLPDIDITGVYRYIGEIIQR